MLKKQTGNVISSIKVKKKQVVIDIKGNEKITLSYDSYSDFHLYEGKELSKDELNDLKEYAKTDGLFEYAMKILSNDPKSTYRLRTKLLDKGATKEEAKKIISRLTKLGLLDDGLYARTYATDVATLRLYGKNKVIFNLKRRGISDEIIASLEFPREKEIEKAFEAAKIANRSLNKEPSMRKAAKMRLHLIDRGFESDIIEEAIRNCLTPTSKQDELSRLKIAYQTALAKYSRKVDGYKLKSKIFAYLVSKGYQYEDIENIMEENDL